MKRDQVIGSTTLSRARPGRSIAFTLAAAIAAYWLLATMRRVGSRVSVTCAAIVLVGYRFVLPLIF